MLGPSETDDQIIVGMQISCKSEEEVVRVSEAFARIATGLALEGMNVNFNMIKINMSEDPP
jgi:hypothetical protein